MMAKKIRFPLEMDNGIEVRSIEELRDNFSLARVLAYYKNGKLAIWLRDRYANDLADAIEAVNPSEQNLAKKLSEIFDIPYDEKIETELKKAAEKEERLKRLKQFTQEQSFIDHIDFVAFDQDELYDLLDEDTEKIYLCGDRFSIPLSKQGVSYVGINNPIAVIDSKVEVDWHEKKISVEGVIFDEKYQNILNSPKVVETIKDDSNKLFKIGEYSQNTYLRLFLQNDKNEVKRMYNAAKIELLKLDYNIDTEFAEQENENETNLVKIGEYSNNTYLNVISSNNESDIRKLFDMAKMELERLEYNMWR